MKTKRVFIGIFGRRNQGKSSLVNALAGQEVAIVSDTAGTTTDPVRKSIEIFGIGPVVLVDTAGIDDTDTLGRQRVRKSLDTLKTIDVAILVISHNSFDEPEKMLVQQFATLDIPFVVAHNKSDIAPLTEVLRTELQQQQIPVVTCSANNKQGISELIDTLVHITPATAYQSDTLVGDLVQPGNEVALVMPQDEEAPEGRLILPQVQVIRDLLDNHALAVAIQPEEVPSYLQRHTPNFIITDSQIFDNVAKQVPAHIPLTSFSIILSRAKGNFNLFMQGTPHIAQLQTGDKILMLESCTHVSSCEDIGRHKIPTLLQKVTGKQLHFDFVTALNPLPEDLAQYALSIQCGGCMVTKKQLRNRVTEIANNGIPITNYGMTIAFLTGIFPRVTAMFHT